MAGRGLVELDPELVELRGFPDEKTLAITQRSPTIIAVMDIRMSASGTKRTCPARHIMSVLGGKADIKDAVSDFR
jgi:hypothetical protein